jgi:hypothetical protein
MHLHAWCMGCHGIGACRDCITNHALTIPTPLLHMIEITYMQATNVVTKAIIGQQ